MARILVNAINEPGTLATIAQTVGQADVNISILTMIRVAPDFSEMELDLEVWDLRQLSHLLSQIKDLECISTVKRVFD
jgi:GTP diphosphokinase / guanosine-3',5'-bis(diphosphate) 3'-diphosphatase